MHFHSLLLACALIAAPLCGQNALSPVTDVGLTIDRGSLPGVYGTSCGNALCITTQAGAVVRGQPRVVTVFGAPTQPFALAVSLGQPTCSFTVVGGQLIDNGLMLPQPLTLVVGITSPLVPSLPCPQGTGVFSLLVPTPAPMGIQFLLQAVVVSPTYRPMAFTGALQAVVQ